MKSQNLESCLKLKIPLLVFCMLDLDCHETLGVSRNDKKQTIASLREVGTTSWQSIIKPPLGFHCFLKYRIVKLVLCEITDCFISHRFVPRNDTESPL
ncbi:hypothetical protein [Helicobacter rodentium]|uniref:hypothetical protein n=1 Tax=Helicobacter rodentium TaxID=59617 RepID=UPI0012EC3C60|nr:hypothetical protein [Helicobacter rodentium]